MNGTLVEPFAGYLERSDDVLTPTIILYEVYKKLKGHFNEEFALNACAQIEKTHLVPLTSQIAYKAADVSLQYKLAMADAIVFATASVYGVKLVTSDSDFENLPDVIYLNEMNGS